MPQRPSPTPRRPRHLRTSSSDSDPLHQRPITDRTPKLGVGDRRSPRSTQSDPFSQKKLGTRITDLETQLVLAQHELKSLKQQLSSAEAEKKRAQEELHKKGTKRQTTSRKAQGQEIQKTVLEDMHPETDVFEVPVEKTLVKPEAELSHCSVDSAISEPDKPSLSDELASKVEEIVQLRTEIEKKEKKFQVVTEENETLKEQLEEAKLQIGSARSKEEEMTSKVNQLEKELDVSKDNTAKLEEKVLEVEAAKESLEAEMNKMKVQTEQWRKAADAAAAVLAGGVEMNGRISNRCASMDKHFNGVFEPPINEYGGFLGSPGDDIDDGFGGGKKKGSGIRMLGDLWRKKGQK